MARKPTTLFKSPASSLQDATIPMSTGVQPMSVFSHNITLPVPGPRRTDPAHLDQGVSRFFCKAQTANTSGFTGYPVSATG